MAVVNLEFRCRENAARIAERIRTPAHDHTQGSDHLRLVTLTGICFFPAIPLLLENRWNADFHVFSGSYCVQLGNARGVERPPVGEPICCTATSAGACDSMTAPTLSTSVALHVDWRSAGLSYAFAVTGGGRRE